MNEIDYKLTVNSHGIIVSESDEVLKVRVAEWLETPQGEMWGAPHWGHRLKQYKHEPANANTEAAIENSILLTLPIDVAGVTLEMIDVKSIDFDMYRISIKLKGSKKLEVTF